MDHNVEQRDSGDDDDPPADVDVRDKGDQRDHEGVNQGGKGAARRQFSLLVLALKDLLWLNRDGDEEQANQRAVGGEAGGEEGNELIGNHWRNPSQRQGGYDVLLGIMRSP